MPSTPTTTTTPPRTDVVCEGVVDGVEGTYLRGWAWITSDPASKPVIEISVGGRPLARGVADLFRRDLAVAGKGAGSCAFAIRLDPPPAPGTRLDVVAVYAGTRQALTGSPCEVVAVPDAGTADALPDVFPLPLETPALRGSIDECGPRRLRGWACRTDRALDAPELVLCEADRAWSRLRADAWRADLADRFGGQGYCGFDVALPDALLDGQVHTFHLRLAESGEAACDHPFRARMGRQGAAAEQRARLPDPLRRAPAASSLALSVVVNFHDMRREAERTLTSLTRGYQLDIPALDYEVLCVDNGSDPPLDADWIAAFGPEFRLIRVAAPAPSPCAALNAAAIGARGRYLALMIDGAHVLTPGVLREAVAAWREDPQAVVALRHWFVGGDQRWLAAAGYSRGAEDRLFERIHWPNDGYALFRIGAPIGEQPEPWFDGLSESNCLMLPTALFDRIGGFDAAFAEAGGGFANLDLWRRASDAAEGTLVALVGEASFHQFHHGTTTNVPDAAKDANVRRYAADYERLRGHAFRGVHRKHLRFRGRMSSEQAVGIRQRPLMPVDMAVTSRIRRGTPARHFDEGARAYLQSSWAESGLVDEVTWLGQPTGVAASDLNAIQRILCERQPDAVVAVDTQPGLVRFIAAVLDADHANARVIHACGASAPEGPARVETVVGAADGPTVQANVRQRLGGAENVLVVLSCPADASLDPAALRAWGALVSHRSWLIVTATVFGQPWLGYAVQHHLQAVRAFVADAGSPFVIDRSANRQWLTACPDGCLRRIGGSLAASAFDPALDTPLPTGLAELHP